MKTWDFYSMVFLVTATITLPVIFVTFALTDNPYITWFVGYVTSTVVNFIIDAIKYPWEK